MTYREKLSESEHKAHYQNIATKILREMTALRSSVETSPNTPRRWVWELLQNAKDVNNGKAVNIKISQKEKNGKRYLYFQHDGRPFSADNIRFLIEQISSKDRTKDEDGKRKETGKFGTGFLTTHLLSEKVAVKGVAKEDGLDYRKFTLKLDRSGFEIDEIIKAVEESKNQILDIDSLEPYRNYKDSDFNTTFIYYLEDELSEKVTRQGLNDLNNNLPFTLCFVDKINTVTIEPQTKFFKVLDEETIDKDINLKFFTVEIASELDDDYLNFISLSEELTSIMIPVKRIKNKIVILPLDINVPRLFCDFPLLGTETFPFPAVINNQGFNPTDPRDGIFLNDSPRPNPLINENKKIVLDAVNLYFDLLDFAIKNNWENLHLLSKIGILKDPTKSNTSSEWFEHFVQKPIKQKLINSKIVKNSLGNLCSILNTNGSLYIQFPSGGTKDIRKKIWELAKTWFPQAIPEVEQIEYWNYTIWPECGKLTLSKLAEFVQSRQKLSTLDDELIDTNAIEWLNSFYEVLMLDKNEYLKIIDKNLIVPDQNGYLVRKGQLRRQSGEILEAFKDILELFNIDIRAQLIDENIILDFEDHDKYSQSDLVKMITNEVLDKTNDRDVAQKFRPALNMILKYFNDKPASAKILFPAIYSKKHMLYDDEEIMDNISKAEELKDLFSVFEVASSDELRKKFESLARSNTQSLLPVTQEILTSMGITNIAEWNEAMRDTDLKALFAHQSVPTQDMFLLSQTHINKARNRVIDHLETLDEYDLSELDPDTAPTILAGVYKNGIEVIIVFRPAYSKEVIVYYGAEKDALDYAAAELWVDDGIEVRQITLGYILKKNNIKKFPI